MKTIKVVNGPQNVSEIILGCMRMPALSVEDAAVMIRTAADEGVNFFDHATCYQDGEAESRFGDAFCMTGLKRQIAMYILKLLKCKRVTAGIVAFMMLAVVLFSVFFTSAEAGHHCCGENCPICVCIQQCENTLKHVGGSLACLAVVILHAIVLFYTAVFSSCTFCQETPITRKVRLNN